MLKNLFLFASFMCALSATSLCRAQALPTATARGALQVGGGVSLAVPDYGQKNIEGLSVFADFDFAKHIGVEGDFHYIALVTPTDLAENTYLVGPRFTFTHGRFTPYAKVMGGVGSLVIQEVNDNVGRYSGNYFAFAFGGGLDITVRRHLVVRAIDAEVQKWPGLGNGLSPYVFTVGAAYRFR
jgi:Outer membrane protein beta-barrel domain